MSRRLIWLNNRLIKQLITILTFGLSVVIPTTADTGTLNYTPYKTVETLIEQTFPEESERMIAIAKAESELDTNAYNPEWHYDRDGNKICQGSYGLFQIACVNYSGDANDLFDPQINLQIAKTVLNSQGVMAWGVCHNGSVDCVNT